MTLGKLEFTKNWENPEDFPTVETDETQVRRDMQLLHDEIKNYLNSTVVPAFNNKQEIWTFTLEDGSTVTKTVVLA